MAFIHLKCVFLLSGSCFSSYVGVKNVGVKVIEIDFFFLFLTVLV